MVTGGSSCVASRSGKAAFQPDPLKGTASLTISPSERTEKFRVENTLDGDVVRVVPRGELDLASADVLQDRIGEVLDAGYRDVVLDLRGLTFMDSTGVRLVLELDALARRDGLDLALIQGPPAVARVFEIASLTQRLPFRAA